MSIIPDKYVSVEISILGVASLIMSELKYNDTVSTLWERLSQNSKILTFERFAAGLSLLYAIKIIQIERGILRKVVSSEAK